MIISNESSGPVNGKPVRRMSLYHYPRYASISTSLRWIVNGLLLRQRSRVNKNARNKRNGGVRRTSNDAMSNEKLIVDVKNVRIVKNNVRTVKQSGMSGKWNN